MFCGLLNGKCRANEFAVLENTETALMKLSSWTLCILVLIATGDIFADEVKITNDNYLINILDCTKLGFEKKHYGKITNKMLIERMKQKRHNSQLQQFYGYNPREDAIEQAEELLKNGYKIRELPPFMLTPPIDWGANPNSDKNWHFQINTLRQIVPLFYANYESGDAKYMNIARRVVLDWIDFNIIKNQSNALKWHDMSTGLRADKLAYFIDHDLRQTQSDASVLAVMIAAAKVHADVLRYERVNPGNHGLFQMLGLSAICHALPELIKHDNYFSYAQDRMVWLLGRQFNEKGIHLEHSTGYHIFVYETLLKIDDTGYFDKNKKLQDILKKVAANIVWLFHPNGDLVMVGDSDRSSISEYEEHHPHIEYVVSDGKKGEKPPVNFAVFPKVGYAILRSCWEQKPFKYHSYLYLSAAYHSKVHKHPDDLTFEWSELGQPIIIDSGKYSYGSSFMRDFFRNSTRAHNTIEIDNKDYPVSNRYAFGSALKHWGKEKGIYFIGTKVNRDYWSIRHKRILFMKMKKWLCVVDILESENERTYKQWFHFHEDIEAEKKDDVIELQLPGTATKVYVQELVGKLDEIKLVKGQKSPRTQGWVSPTYEKILPRYTVGFVKKGRSRIFTTLFYIGTGVTDTQVSYGPDQTLQINWKEKAGATREKINYSLAEGKLF